MDGLIHELLLYIINDPGKGGIIAIMMVITGGAIWLMDRKDREYKADIKDIIDQFQKQSDENRHDLMEIIEKYQEGQINVIQAINEIKILLATIGAKL